MQLPLLRSPNPRRTPRFLGAASPWLVLLVATLALLLGGCGDDAGQGPGGTQVQTTPYDEGLTRMEAAGTDVQKLQEVRLWLRPLLASATGVDQDNYRALDQRLISKVRDGFKVVATANARERKKDVLERLAKWAETQKADGGPVLIDALQPGLSEIYFALSELEPDRDDLREKAGFTKLDLDFDEVVKVPYIDEETRKLAKSLKEKVRKYVPSDPGRATWLPPSWDGLDELDRMHTHLEELEEAYQERMKDPWEQSAAKLASITIKAMSGDEGISDAYRWVARTHKPYLILVEEDKAWNENKIAEEKYTALRELYDTFYGEYRDLLGLVDITAPIPVVVFKRHNAYQNYAVRRGADKGAVGHFEHDSGRLILSDETDIGTVIHEGTHQLVASNTNRAMSANFLDRSYWFQEGVAEFFAGNHRYLDKKTDHWRYEIGLLQKGRLSYWRQNPQRAYTLWDLISLTYRNREENKTGGDEARNLFSYSQGWFLIYFMDKFAVDEEGLVRLDRPGKYRDEWLEYFRQELKGRSGRQVFLECLGLLGPDGEVDQAKWEVFEKEFVAYYEWVNRKISLKHEVDNQLISWDKIERRGKMIGDKIDDMLYRDDEPKRDD